MVEAEIVTRDGSEIVWLARVCVPIISGEQDALLLQVGKILINRGLGEVLCEKSANRYVDETHHESHTHLVLQPNGDESVKHLSLDNISCGSAHSVQGCQPAKGEKGIPHCVFLLVSLFNTCQTALPDQRMV